MGDTRINLFLLDDDAVDELQENKSPDLSGSKVLVSRAEDLIRVLQVGFLLLAEPAD